MQRVHCEELHDDAGPAAKISAALHVRIRAHLMRVRVAMLEFVARMLARTTVVIPFAAQDRSANMSLSRDRWQRLFAARNSSSGPRVRHLFAIERLRKGAARGSYSHCYYCVRCRWAFLVDGRGGVIAVDSDHQPLAHEQAAHRVESFAHGPCGAHWASSAIIDGGLKVSNSESLTTSGRTPLTVVSTRRDAVQ
jgi:hypothetical protein